MLRMDTVHVIRHKHSVEGQSVRRIARELGLHRSTVSKYLEVSEPRRTEREDRPRPVQSVVGPRVEALMEQWEPRLEGKHRLTGTRVHRQLAEEGLSVSERTVRRYLAERRRLRDEVFVPLVHRAGDEAQVDFFEVKVDIGGQRRSVWKFLMRLMYSRRDFIHLYDRCDRPCFLDGHVRALAYFGGVAHRMIYDNLSAAVKRILGLRDRELTERFQALASHYLFEPCFARPGTGHDKGGVEGRGKSIRLQHMTPILAGPDLETIAAAALADVERGWRGRRHEDGRLLSDMFIEELPLLRPLPAAPFEPRSLVPVSVSRSSTVKLDRAVYSVPTRWARLDVSAWVGPVDIRFCCRGETTTRPRVAPGQRHIDYRDYRRELSRKPQAVRQVAPELVAQLGEPYGQLWVQLEKAHGGKQAGRLLAKILAAMEDHGEDAVTAALLGAMDVGAVTEGIPSLLSITHFLPGRPVLADSMVPAALRAVVVDAGCAADYDTLLTGGAQ